MKISSNKKLLLMLGVWFCVYPLVTVILYTIRALGLSLPLEGQTFVATLILVPLMVNWIVPFVKGMVEQPTNQLDGEVD